MYSGGSKGNIGKEKIKGSYLGSWLIRSSLFRFLNERVHPKVLGILHWVSKSIFESLISFREGVHDNAQKNLPSVLGKFYHLF